jgi:hypothetical protein
MLTCAVSCSTSWLGAGRPGRSRDLGGRETPASRFVVSPRPATSRVPSTRGSARKNAGFSDVQAPIRRPTLSPSEVATRWPRPLPRSPKSPTISMVRPDRFERTTFGFEVPRIMPFPREKQGSWKSHGKSWSTSVIATNRVPRRRPRTSPERSVNGHQKLTHLGHQKLTHPVATERPI